MADFEILDFDSELFGFKVAKILPNKLTAKKLSHLLEDLRHAEVRLVYWSTDSHDTETQAAALEVGGILVDHKATFLVALSSLTIALLSDARAAVETYPYPVANQEIKKLAEQVGAHSRFGVDPHMPLALMKKMYHRWIENSIRGGLAKQVLIVRRGMQMAGMVTLGEKNGRGDIGLIAVSERFQHQGVGKLLVRAAQAQFLAEGFEVAQVVTQMENRAACHLYHKMGYEIERIENFFHFWL